MRSVATTTRRRNQAGQSTAEYVGIVAFVALLAVAVLAFVGVIAPQAGDIAKGALCKVGETVGAGGDCGGSDGSDRPGGPGETDPDDVDIPDGLDPDSDLVEVLLSTQRGRDTLQWLADNDIEVVIDPSQTGAYWNGSEIVLGGGQDNAAVFIHEANHARYTADGRSAEATELSRDDYVRDAILEETDGVVQQIIAAREFRDAGHTVPQQPGEAAYTQAYDEAIANGATPEAANQAGFDAVNQEFYNGGFVTSTNGQSYPDYYGAYWDSVN
jgi:hypothetical protein